MPTSPARDKHFPGIAVGNCIGSALNIGDPARRGRGAYVRRMGVHTRQNAREKKKEEKSNSENRSFELCRREDSRELAG